MFSVVVPTYAKPALLERALDSLARQVFPAVEIVVVRDGWMEEAPYAAAAGAAARRFGDRLRWLEVGRRAQGSGPAFARNVGASAARYDYLAFLDDDDVWTDDGYLARAARLLEREPAVDAVFADQTAVTPTGPVPGPLWLDRVATALVHPPPAGEPVAVDLELLLRAGGFCHLNTTIVRRAVFEELGGFDEQLRYEEDRDFFLRLIDRAGELRYLPVTVARHHVPAASDAVSASASLSWRAKLLDRARIFDKARLDGRHAALRREGRRRKGETLKRLAELLNAAGARGEAASFALEALVLQPTGKWTLWTAWLLARALASVGRPARRARPAPPAVLARDRRG